MTTANTSVSKVTRESVPWLAAIVCFIVPVIPTISVLPGPLRGHGSPARMLAYICMLLVVVGFLKARATPKQTMPSTGTLLLLGFLFLQLLTYAMGLMDVGNAVVESSKTRTALITLADVGVALYIIQSVHTFRQRSIVLGTLVAGLAFACTVGILQGLTPLDLRFMLVPPGFVENLEASGLSVRGAAVRVLGTSDHAIEFAVVAAATVPLALHFARFGSTPIRRQLSTIACVLAFMSVPLAVSRTGVITLIGALVFYAFSMRLRFLGNAAVIGVGILLFYKIVYPGPLNSLISTITGSGTDDSIRTRTEDYEAVQEQFRADPFFGLGLGGYPPTEFRYLDNQWLQAIVQGGLVGLTAMVVLTVGGIVGITSSLRRSTTERDRDQSYAIGAAFIGCLASSFTFDLFTFQQATFIVFILFGLLWSARGQDTNEAGEIGTTATIKA